MRLKNMEEAMALLDIPLVMLPRPIRAAARRAQPDLRSEHRYNGRSEHPYNGKSEHRVSNIRVELWYKPLSNTKIEPR